MTILWVKYVRAEIINPLIRAKKSLPSTGIIKVTAMNPDLKITYEVVKGRPHLDMQKDFSEDHSTAKIKEELAGLTI